ncbi:MAG: tRNA-dihydrouridine synthase [Candidatus Paceibacterota bacterium]
MKLGFWKKLKKPIFSLAPMADVTDSAFRQTILKFGRPAVFFTWFVSADGLASAGKKNLLRDLSFVEKERPLVAQIFGANPENFSAAVKIIKNLGFDGIDINMGCPEKKIMKQGAGAALIDNSRLAKKIISAALSVSGRLPVSVKTRLGNKAISSSWIKSLAKTGIAALTIHGRLAKDDSKYPADWNEIKKAAALAKKINPRLLVFGNGDVKNLAEAKIKAELYHLDGIMLGRAVFGNPWLFNEKIKKENLPPEKIVQALLEHLRLFKKYHSYKNPALMKKHFGAYVSGWPKAKNLRIKLMRTKTLAEAETILRNFSS